MWYQTADPDPHTTVDSVTAGYRFHCPDIPSIDRHIVELLGHLGPRSNLTPKRKLCARHDIDRLLDRRLWLEMTG